MRRSIANAVIFSILLSIGCGQSEHHHESDEHKHAPMVELNNGERWEANIETTEGIADMHAHLVQYHEGSMDAPALHGHLLNEFNTIFAKCTMTGEAHDQLHNYLIPLKAQLQELENCRGEACDEIAGNIEKHLEEYDTYFQ